MPTLALQPCGAQLEAPQLERMSQAIEDLGCRLDRIEGLLFLSDFEHFQKLDALIKNCKETVCGQLTDGSESNLHIEVAETRSAEHALAGPVSAEAKAEFSEVGSASSEPIVQQMCSDVHRNLASAMLAKQRQEQQQVPQNPASSKKQKKQRKQQLQEEAGSSSAVMQHADCVEPQRSEAISQKLQRSNEQKLVEARCREANALQECMRIAEIAKKSRFKPQLKTIPGNRPVGFSSDSGASESGQQQEEQPKNPLSGRTDDGKKIRFRPQLMTIPGNRAVGSLDNPSERDDSCGLGKSCSVLQAQLAWSQTAVQESSLESQKPPALNCQRSMFNMSDFSDPGDADTGLILECFGGKGGGLSWKGKGAGLPLALSHAAEPGSETI
eukprot:TRINITY_DN87654_c0_g1_i1.p1 TRINITY_DN87654_c0_g1~~TRINITY_DN87654_c0_g1_i1.p1  ORF type:complete len:384 (+),score=96.60 TRINITY_DN87654_c0_g1_i1:88-1239(+)